MSNLRLVVNDDIEIPKVIRDVAGYEMDLRSNKWRLNSVESSRTSMNWSDLINCDEDAVSALKLHVIRLIETSSPSHAMSAFQFVGTFLKALRDGKGPTRNIDLRSLLWWLEELRLTRVGYKFHHLRLWYVMSADRMLEGFDDEVVYAIKDLRIEGNAKGFAVLSSDTDEGPLNEFEEEALRSALLRDEGPIEQRAALWLAFAYGTNPANLALLREEDFVVKSFDDETPTEHFLNIPRIKKRVPPRTEFKTRYVAPELARVLDALIAYNRKIAPDDTNRPMFRRQNRRSTLIDGPLHDYAYHNAATDITSLLAKCAGRLAVTSPRTNKSIVLNARRLRYTFATKMVRQGIAARDLAELLDHTDLQNVQVYYKADSRFVERLDKTIAIHLGPKIEAFMGKIVKNSTATIDLISYSNLPDIGQCGASFSCALAPPKSCYTCPQFNAFEDGPHVEVLADLIEERNQLLTGGHERIAEQLDRPILAVGEVAARTQGCKA